MDVGTVLGVIGALTVARGCMWIIDLAEGRVVCAAAWDKVFGMFDKADVRGVELAAILTPERRK